ncbi:DEAD/DEAH box helicase [Ruthenibacterium sp. TH_2024_36131]|uniref:DEAD/DEAH box helicase n=1 Tax=Owariibacterium komagatae TaxID=3136601 RepID=UPI0038B38568
MAMNPRETTEKIRTDYENYLCSILTVRDAEITRKAHASVHTDRFVKGPYLETTLPFVNGKSLKELVDEGLLSQEFAHVGGALHYDDWKLRCHQEIALRKCVQEGRNIIVSTGTGSGKTECYLYPILDSLLKEKEKGTLGPGVRALLLFPMNALANDQQKKLHKLLHDYPDITFGRYTGETPHKGEKETSAEAEARLHSQYNNEHLHDADPLLRTSIPNEVMCRETMIENPPHILLTNYAMLEYLLLQPDTAPFFDTEFAFRWQFLVLDEAHTYKGATGTEIAFLLRRLKERIRGYMHNNFRCIATSATLGSSDAQEGLAQFASKLFGEPFFAEDVVTSKRIHPEAPEDAKLYRPEFYHELNEETRSLTESERNSRLYEVLIRDRRLYRLYAALEGIPQRLEDVANVIFPDAGNKKEAEAALIDMVEMAAAAKPTPENAALLPARYHLFLKALEGLFVQLYPNKQVFLDRHEQSSGQDGQRYPVFELANCQNCGQEYLVGRQKDSPTGGKVLAHSSDMEQPEFYLINQDFGEEEVLFDSDDETDVAAHYKNKKNKMEKYHLCLACGSITPFSNARSGDCCTSADPMKIVTVVRIPFTGRGQDVNCCPCCGTTRHGLIRRFLTANQPATFTIAKSLYDAIPPRPLERTTPTIQNSADALFASWAAMFDTESVPEETQDETGRKLLIFSDNRQEAAFFAGYFEKKYRQIMWRRLILNAVRRAGDRGIAIDSLIQEVEQEARRCSLYQAEAASDAYQQRKIAGSYVMSEFIDMDVSTGLEGLGYLMFSPNAPDAQPQSLIPGLTGLESWNLLRYLMDTLRQKGACSFPDKVSPVDDFFAPRNRIYSFRSEGSQSSSAEVVLAFCPAEGRINKRAAFLQKLLQKLGRSEVEAQQQTTQFLSDIAGKFVPHITKLFSGVSDRRLGYRYQLDYHAWKVTYLKEEDLVYRCQKCGKITSYNIRGCCPEMKCSGTLEKITAGQARTNVYYRHLLEKGKIIPMEAREHTAQLSAQTAAQYQREFEEGKINVLSCSTTFEMGVDVGELEATFLRNIPPETANYIQRAGRAGRRTSSAAFSVTFARRVSHDMTFFQTPEKIIAGNIRVPSLEISNEKIAERHLNSIVISWFFKKQRQYFDGNVRAIIAVGDADTPNMAQALHDLLQTHPRDLLEEIHRALSPEICEQLGVDHWKFIEQLTGAAGSLTKAVQERAGDIQSLQKFQMQLDTSKKADQSQYNNAGRLIRTLERERAINFLSSHGVLPKYGFPVDSVNLNILYQDTKIAGSIDLTRDLKIAISEFAPPASVVANGRVWTSYAINTVPNQSWPTYVYYTCPECKRIFPPVRGMVNATFRVEDAEACDCPSCGVRMKARKFIIPQFGFSTKIDDQPRLVGDSRPKTYYATQTQFWGLEGRTERQLAEAQERDILLAGKKISLVYSPGGQLFVLNQGNKNRGFCTCPDCGYTIDPQDLRKGPHRTKFNRSCSTQLEHVSLGHRFSTDILKIALPLHYVRKSEYQDKDQAASVLYAILEGASAALDISREDISGCVNYTTDGTQELILFDDTPGGAGFSKLIFEKFEQVIHEAINQVSGACGCSPETSCYGCLRNYGNQMVHEFLSRGLALDYLKWLATTLPQRMPEDAATLPEVHQKQAADILGRKKSGYCIGVADVREDCVAALRECLEGCKISVCRQAYETLLTLCEGKHLQTTLLDNKIPLPEGNVWPAIFWPDSQVALFETDAQSITQCEILSEYDWHCFVLNEQFKAETVIKLIQEES